MKLDINLSLPLTQRLKLQLSLKLNLYINLHGQQLQQLDPSTAYLVEKHHIGADHLSLIAVELYLNIVKPRPKAVRVRQQRDPLLKDYLRYRQQWWRRK